MRSMLIPSAAITALTGADIAVAAPAECAELLKQARLVRGWLDFIEAKVTSRVAEHHAAGQSAPAADAHTSCGGVSAAEARRKERRSKTINDAPEFGDALAEGDIGAEHVDQLAAATARLDDSVTAALLDQDDLLDAARSQTPEQFGQTVRDRARTLEADNGIERNKQQRKQTFLSHKVNHATGMHEGRFAFHPELGAQIFSAIDRQVLKNIKAGTRRGDAEFVDRTFDRGQQAAIALGDIITRATSTTSPGTASSAGTTNSHSTATTRISAHSTTAKGNAEPAAGATTNGTPNPNGTRATPSTPTTNGTSRSNGSPTTTSSTGNSASPGGWTGNASSVGAPSGGCAPSSVDAPTSVDAPSGDERHGVQHHEPVRDHADADGGRGIEADITVIIDYQTATTGEFHDHSVCETSDGAVLPPASVQRLLCNGRVTPVIMDSNGNPFDLGRTVRHANRRQRRALRTIYRSCGFPGCDVDFDRCEIHHIVPWELGGRTDLNNLIPMCSRHHHVIHEGGWALHLAPDRTATVTQPNGQIFGSAEPDMNRQSFRSPPTPSAAELAAERLLAPLVDQRADLRQPACVRSPDPDDEEFEQMNLLAG